MHKLPFQLVLAHGAGASSQSEFMRVFAGGLTERGLTTVTFDFRYMEAGRRVPDRMPQLVERMRSVAQDVASEVGSPQLVLLGGKSMGGRVATHLAAEGYPCAGLVLLGYPLHPAGKPQERREAHLPSVRVPALFVSGTRDALAERALLEKAAQNLGGPTTLHWIEDGDHSLEPRARSGRTAQQAWDEAMDAIVAFARRLPVPAGVRKPQSAPATPARQVAPAGNGAESSSAKPTKKPKQRSGKTAPPTSPRGEPKGKTKAQAKTKTKAKPRRPTGRGGR